MPSRDTESIAREVQEQLGGVGQKRTEEKEQGDGEEQFPDRDSEELGMQFSFVLGARRGGGRKGILPQVAEAGSLGSVGGVNFYCPLSRAIEKK